GRDLTAQQLDLILGVQKITRPGAHQAADGDGAFGTDLAQQLSPGGQPADSQGAAQLQAVGAAAYGGHGGCKTVNTNSQQRARGWNRHRAPLSGRQAAKAVPACDL